MDVNYVLTQWKNRADWIKNKTTEDTEGKTEAKKRKNKPQSAQKDTEFERQNFKTDGENLTTEDIENHREKNIETYKNFNHRETEIEKVF